METVGKKERGSERERGRCAHFIKKRGRFCRLAVAKGSEFCGEHLTFDPNRGATSERRRIPCPLDPHHTVYEHQLEAHLKKCNVTKRGVPVCYRANINTGILDYQLSDEEKRPLSAFSQEQLAAVIAKVEKVYKEYMGQIEEVVLEHPVMTSDLSDPTNGVTALKHIRQQASILGHLERLGLIQPNTCFIEFGAGRGKLSNCLQRVCVDEASIRFLLVDRASCRRKKDVYLRGDPTSEARVGRLHIDIEHLDLGRVESLLEGEMMRRVVAISKHLCGPATDMTLRCLLETLPQSHDQKSDQPMGLQESSDVTLHHTDSCLTEPPETKRKCTENVARSSSKLLCGIVIALCCHHRCSWSHLAGTAWLHKHGFSPVDVYLIAKMTSWAVCGVRSPDQDSSDVEHDHTDDIGPESNSSLEKTPHSVAMATSSAPHPPSYHPHPRESVGLKCKRVLDMARLSYLRERGMDSRLVYFVSRSTSLENVLLIATPRTNS